MIRYFLVLVLLGSSQAHADLKGTGNFSAWDEVSLKYESGNVQISTNGELMPLLYELSFDTDLADNRAKCSVEHFDLFDPSLPGCISDLETDAACWTENADHAGLIISGAIPAHDETDLEYISTVTVDYPDGQWVHSLVPGSTSEFDDRVGLHRSAWSGFLGLAMYHVDTGNVIPVDPLDAEGFRGSRDWRIVSCDIDDSGKFLTPDRDPYANAPGPPTSSDWPLEAYAPYAVTSEDDGIPTYGGTDVQDSIRLLLDSLQLTDTTDPISQCGGNCEAEIATIVGISLDNNCDGNLDAAVPQTANGSPLVCFAARVVKPDQNTWTNAFQGRISTSGGDKTVNFSLFGPTAVSINSVALESALVSELLAGFGIEDLSNERLLGLLAVFSPDRANDLVSSSSAGSDSISRQAILDQLAAHFDPDGDQQAAVLKWDTLEERGTIGFYVERQAADNSWASINEDMLPGLISAPMGGEYILIDPAATSGNSYTYRLIEQEATGKLNVYGPYTIEMP